MPKRKVPHVKIIISKDVHKFFRILCRYHPNYYDETESVHVAGAIAMKLTQYSLAGVISIAELEEFERRFRAKEAAKEGIEPVNKSHLRSVT